MANGKGNGKTHKTETKHHDPPPAAPKEQTEQLATRPAPEPQQVVPPAEPYRTEVVDGFENMAPDDMAKPRLALCQGQTPQRNEDDPKYIPGLKEGDFFNSITSEIYGREVMLTPLMFFKYRLRFGTKQEGNAGKLVCQSPNGVHGVGDPGIECAKCDMRLWVPEINNGKPRCGEVYGYASLVVPKDGKEISPSDLVVVGLKSANTGLAKEWNSKMYYRLDEQRRRLPMWRGIYKLVSKPKKFELGTAYLAIPENAGKHELNTTNAHICKASYEMIHELYAAGRLAVDLEEPGPIEGEEAGAHDVVDDQPQSQESSGGPAPF